MMNSNISLLCLPMELTKNCKKIQKGKPYLPQNRNTHVMKCDEQRMVSKYRGNVSRTREGWRRAHLSLQNQGTEIRVQRAKAKNLLDWLAQMTYVGMFRSVLEPCVRPRSSREAELPKELSR